jgi:hypothetical protein
MSDKRKRQPHEVWDALEKMALEDEAERVAAMSDEQLDAELRAAGIDPEETRRKGDEIAARAAEIAGRAGPVPVEPAKTVTPTPPAPKKHPRWSMPVVAAMLVAAAAVYLVVGPTRGPSERPLETASPPPDDTTPPALRDAGPEAAAPDAR